MTAVVARHESKAPRERSTERGMIGSAANLASTRRNNTAQGTERSRGMTAICVEARDMRKRRIAVVCKEISMYDTLFSTNIQG